LVRPPGWRFCWIGVDQRRRKFGHSLAPHAAMLKQPLAVLFQEYRADQPGDANLIREDIDGIDPPLDLFLITMPVLCRSNRETMPV